MKLHRWVLFLFVTFLLAACNTSITPDLGEVSTQVVKDRYIVVLNETFAPGGHAANQARAAEIARGHGLDVYKTYGTAIFGFAAVIPEGRLSALQRDPRVKYVAQDLVRTISAQSIPTGIKRIFADTNANLDIDSNDDYRVDVDVAVIDTGVDFEHYDLDVVGGVNCTGGGPFNGSCKSGGDDDHYHGTHVAGTIGAIDDGVGVVGVAPGARILAVKVLDSRGSGYSSWIIAGIDWVAANASTIEVANMSLGGSGHNQGEYDAIQGAVDKGVAFAVAAGNSDDDAKNYSPAAFDNVLTVSALADFNGAAGGGAASTCRADQDDTLADFSNWGDAVQIAAPGVCILSTYPIEQGEYGTISGTSMASPHAAGALALLASSNNPSNATDVYNLYDQVKNTGNYNWIDDSGDRTQEPLLDVSTFSATLIAGGGSGGGDSGGGVTTISLSVTTYKVQGQKYADLTWSGATSTDVDIYRDSNPPYTTANDGAYTDGPLGKGGGSATYRVCEADTTTCSVDVTATW